MEPPLFSYVGDDFTGSTDVMEVLQAAGLRTVLFLDVPTPTRLSSFSNLRAFGVAGRSRSLSPREMEIELLPIFAGLRDSGSKYVHYKTCSTGDSSPLIGSIGKAIELGRDVFGRNCVPVLIAAPRLGRYQAFGNIFARSGTSGAPFRLDRHPTMRVHPVTPMHESDFRAHLQAQTNLKIDLIDCVDLENYCSAEISKDSDILLLDALYEDHLPRIGEIVHRMAQSCSQKLVVGSSGIVSALTTYWQQVGHIDSKSNRISELSKIAQVDQVLVLSGSCSPVSQRQAEWAETQGFVGIAIQPDRLVIERSRDAECERICDLAVASMRHGKSPLLHTVLGPHDARISQLHRAYASQGLSELDIQLENSRRLGPELGRIVKKILECHPVPRVGIAGGDTSSYVARTLEIEALETTCSTSPGAPLCTVYSQNQLNGISMTFKGGQVGNDEFWGSFLRGNPNLPS